MPPHHAPAPVSADVRHRGRASDGAAGWLRRWWRNDSGQDLIEYALLATVIGLVGVLAFETLGSNMNTSYRSWDTAVQDVWEVPPPVPVTP